MTEKEFIKKCKDGVSMAQVARDMGIPFTTFVRKAKKLNCYIPNQNWRKGKNTLTDDRIQTKYHNSLFVENSISRRGYIKNLIIKNNLLNYECAGCGIGKIWNGNYLTLQLDHINGVRNDNRLENLRFLCPNCHSQTETYCSKNVKSTNFNSLNMEYILEIIKTSYSLSDAIYKLGLNDTTRNRLKIKNIIEEYKYLFDEGDNTGIEVGENNHFKKYISLYNDINNEDDKILNREQRQLAWSGQIKKYKKFLTVEKNKHKKTPSSPKEQNNFKKSKGGGHNKLSEETIKERLEKLKEVDLSKFGWVSIVSEKLGLTHTQVRRFVEKYYIGDYYKRNCK